MTAEQIEVLKECLTTLTAVLTDEILSVERAGQVAEASVKLRVILAEVPYA